ncbi:hypothetical protein ACR8AL_07510 [Clavibacter sepedonicus]|uniref:Uncharacterized protein n=1 Tax=Clavibacter sepedonicus TaxID=31964 RepID=B0RJG3_CLASE|nr:MULTISPECIES: hypothetical protein [Clavibacter]MBD5382458.1 hypothetical protein [Clavibacter sp.]OQJ45293.1 hypothetical protein B5P19_15655 [Clavibacter sepedonicus]OQJ50980.1 hypothetical protein B5P20_16290 [Clavibacter sepedonicus]UUK67210.1 hypothetical protein LRE50_15745 [Clavibacter sepedonicus]CAQ03353.1 hypothetical protein pCSL0110 [Clavibacter sepedonicus]
MQTTQIPTKTVRILDLDRQHKIPYGTNEYGDPVTDADGFIALFDAWEDTRDAHHAGGYVRGDDREETFTVAWHDGDEMNIVRFEADWYSVTEADDVVGPLYSLANAPFDIAVEDAAA